MKLIKVSQKIAFIAIGIFFLATPAQSQLINKGSSLIITPGALLFSDEAFTNTANATVINNGIITTNSNIVNDAGSLLSGDGIYNLQGNFANSGTFNEGISVINFFGSLNSTLQNAGGNLSTLQLSKDANKFVTLLDNATVSKAVIFSNDKNWIKLNTKTLSIAASGDIFNYNNKRYIVTNGNGFLKKEGLASGIQFIFPVGFDKDTYNPVGITPNGPTDSYFVRCLQHALLNGSSGDTISTQGINAGWFVKETTPGGANAVVEVEWKTTDELSGFDFTHCMLSRYNSTGWDFNISQAGTATGTPFRDITRSGLSNFGYFTVLSGNPTFAGNSKTGESDALRNPGTTNQELKVYPTIVQNNLNIDVPFNNSNIQKMNISIIDASGKVAWRKQNAGFESQKISFPDFTPGIYTVLIEYDKNKFVQKIIIGK